MAAGGGGPSGTGGSGTVGSTGDGAEFLVPPDGGLCALAPVGGARCSPCDPTIQNCWPGAKCNAWADDGTDWWNATKCVPYPDAPRQVGQTCTVTGSPTSGVDDCVAGALCWYADPETLEGECVAYCTGSGTQWSCDEPGKVCAILARGTLPLCLDPCDPLAAEACPAGRVCVRVEAAEPNFVCVPAGDGTAGAPCDHPIDCAPGHLCLYRASVPGCSGARSWGCCTPYCDPSQPDADAACAATFADPGAVCRPPVPDAPSPPAGVCALP